MSEEEYVVNNCTRCPELVSSRSQIVNGTGAMDAELLFVGEAPGEQEDTEGEPFVGRSGTVLTDALAQQGIDRSAVRITNTVRCRPAANRDPTSTERDHCREYLNAEITAVDPTAIVTLGKVPSEQLLGRSVAVTNEAGTVVETTIDGRHRQVVIGVHPAATLYDGSQQSAFVAAIDQAIELTDAGSQTSLGEF